MAARQHQNGSRSHDATDIIRSDSATKQDLLLNPETCGEGYVTLGSSLVANDEENPLSTGRSRHRHGERFQQDIEPLPLRLRNVPEEQQCVPSGAKRLARWIGRSCSLWRRNTIR